MLKKVFGIISYFPDNDTASHIEIRRERSRRFRELLFTLEKLWPDTDIMVIAQNWQDFELPEIKNNIIIYHYDRLGILGARKELRKQFLESDYDYLIMLDDDARVDADEPQKYMDMLDQHPDGFAALRKRAAPLNLCAVSKYVYSQVDMPDVDPENSEGFEDNIFVALCFNKFPDRSFIVPAGIVSESSFRYEGPGKCPSTWAKEKKYDWGTMRKNTEDQMNKLYNPPCNVMPEPDENASIDLVIPYVNGSDRKWLQDYISKTKQHHPSPARFRSWGTLKYLFRGVATYMPFVRNIVLILARPSQLPVWIDQTKVRVVYHKDFIPEKFLPTFNSCTIESFLWKIPDLSDRIIYFNDDMFPIAPLKETDFFTDNTPHIKFTELEKYGEKQIFRSQCRSSLDMITSALNLPEYPKGQVFRPYHISSAFIRSDMIKVGELCEDAICSTVSPLRLTKNVNQYIYAYYNYLTGNYIPETVDYKYVEATDKAVDDVVSMILVGECQMLCINDTDKVKDYDRVRYKLNAGFEKKFPKKSRYEL